MKDASPSPGAHLARGVRLRPEALRAGPQLSSAEDAAVMLATAALITLRGILM